MKRTPLSTRRKPSPPSHRRICADVFDRDGGCRLKWLDPTHRCMGHLTPHHLLKASQGGQYTQANLVAICSSGNSWVEDYPKAARSLGLVRYSWETDTQWQDHLNACTITREGL